MESTFEDVLGAETRTLRLERKVIQYQPEKFDDLGPYLYLKHRIVINHAGPVGADGTQTWMHFSNDGEHKEQFAEPGDYLVIDESGKMTTYPASKFAEVVVP
jgi:hypothetical protein